MRVLSLFLVLLLALPTAVQAGQPVATPSPPTPRRDPDGRIVDSDDARLPADAPTLAPQDFGASGDYRIDALLSGYRWPASWTTLTYSFYSDAVFDGSYYGAAADMREVSEPVKANVRRVLAWYATFLNMDFVEVTETPTQIGFLRFMLTSDTVYARAFYPSSTILFHVAGDVHLNPDYDRLGDTNGFQHQPGRHGYVTLIHEIGHALGLKHPFDDNAAVPSPPPYLPPGENNDSHTVMTYTLRGYSAATPMPYDFLALQYLYGARAHWPGDDPLALTARGADQYTRAGSLQLDTPYRLKQTLWDTGGANTLDFSTLPYDVGGYRIDLRELGWSSAQSDYVSGFAEFPYAHLLAGTALAPGVRIARVVNSSSSDTIYAGSGANMFAGYAPGRATGDDTIYGATAEDALDLRPSLPGAVTQMRDGDDLVLTLGATTGRVTLKDYYTGQTPAILFAGGRTFIPYLAR